MKIIWSESNFKFEPKDLWIGFYWNQWGYINGECYTDIYFCLIPTIRYRLRIKMNKKIDWMKNSKDSK